MTRAEAIEDEKMSIQIMIDEAYDKRDTFEVDSDAWLLFDDKINKLLVLKEGVADKYPDTAICSKCKHEFSGRSWDACPECVKTFNALPQPVHTPNAIMPKGRGATWDDHEIHAYTVDGS